MFGASGDDALGVIYSDVDNVGRVWKHLLLFLGQVWSQVGCLPYISMVNDRSPYFSIYVNTIPIN